MLSPALAQEIASDTSAVIGFNVLITDDEGVVIGSGDQRRVGTFHEASVDVMRTHEPVWHTSAQAHELRGVRQGVTLPLVIDGEAVGTVGITGAPQRVRRFGLVVRRQTEILLQESATLRSRLLREHAVEQLVRDIAAFDAELVEPELLVFRAGELGYDLRLRRTCVVVEVTAATRHGSTDVEALRSELLRTVRETFGDPQDVTATLAPGRLAVLHRAADGERALPATCERLADAVGRRHRLRVRTGVGAPAETVQELRDSYLDASDALRLGRRVDPGGRMHAIADLRLHQVLGAVGHRTRTRFADLVAGSLTSQPDWPVLRETVVAWCESGFNLVRAAADLHVHRNTLVYRLDKIERLTGTALRGRRTSLTLYLACLAADLGGPV